jgi:membrane protein
VPPSDQASRPHHGIDGERDAPAEVLTPIPGTPIDPEPRPKPKAVRSLEAKTPWATVGWMAVARFKASRSPLIAGGTAYYAFLAMFSLLAAAFGVAAILGADGFTDWLTDALAEALPGLVGDEGLDTDTLIRIGRTTSIVGLAAMIWSGSAVMVAASDAIHHLYGAPPDGRNLLARRGYLIGWLALLGPLVVLSYTLTAAAGSFGTELLDELGLESTVTRVLVLVGAWALTVALDVGILALLLGRLGGILPPRAALVLGAVVGAVLIGGLKLLMSTIVGWSLSKPEYGAFALPISILVVLWLQAMALYAAASLTAAHAEQGAVAHR